MDDNVAAQILATILRTYPENDPRARARRFFPLFAKIGYFATGLLVTLGAIALEMWSFPLHDLACLLYGMAILPVLGVGGFFISTMLYRITVGTMRAKDLIIGQPQ